MPKDFHKDDDEVTVASGFTMGRCPGCDNIHMAFLDENDEVFAEMVLEDDQWVELLQHLAQIIQPRDRRRMS